MNLITAVYWQALQNHSALLLQQCQYKCIPICLFALCSGQNESQGKAGAYVTGQLLQWFRGQPFNRLARNPDKYFPSLEEHLEHFLGQLDGDLISSGLAPHMQFIPISGIFSVDDHFLLFSSGGQKIFSLNKNLGHGHVQCLTDSIENEKTTAGSLNIRQGILQRKVGLLFVTDTFSQQLTEQDIRECLYVDELCGEDQMQRRLRELGRRGEAFGGRDMAAGMLLTHS